MSKTFSITILGSNSALPTSERYPTAQVLNVSERFFLIDCGEGTQMQLRKNKIKFTKINHIFISHLHGDHCFGLIGLISTMGLLGRSVDLHIYCHPDLEKILVPQLDYFCKDMPFKVIFNCFDWKKQDLIFEDKNMEVYTIPLEHRVPTVGFLFKEKVAERKVRKEFVFKYQPSIKEILAIKHGEPYCTKEGIIILNEDITIEPPKPLSYAFCTDTRPVKKRLDQLKGVDLLYHESTFLKEDTKLAHKTYHSTAEQAALIAKEANVKQLMIGHYSTRYRDLKPFLEEARNVFKNTVLAREGVVVTLA